MSRTMITCAAAAALVFAGAASADTVYYNGALTTNSPTFDNPNGSSAGSGIHYYSVTEFTVSANGNYTFEMASPNTTGTPSNALDTFLRLYTGSFNPASPAGGAFNDDFTGALTVLPGPYAPTISAVATGFTGTQPSSRLLNQALVTGTTYYLVNTSFRETTFIVPGTGTTSGPVGPYYVGMTGPGTITIVPAPASLALLGLGGLIAGRRRRA